jgi:hypothetical protein
MGGGSVREENVAMRRCSYERGLKNDGVKAKSTRKGGKGGENTPSFNMLYFFVWYQDRKCRDNLCAENEGKNCKTTFL